MATLPEEADASETKRRRTPREQIVHSIDRHTAYECNRILRRAGAFWQKEPYDHWIRSPEQLERILLYIDGNPVKAGYLTAPQEWQFSSAYDRRLLGLELGEPLLKIMAR